METANFLLSVSGALLAIASFIISRQADRRAKKAEAIKQLLSDKEYVSFAAIKLLRDGLPLSAADRRLYIDSIVQACIFEGSDRARALLYRVIEQNRKIYREELEAALNMIYETFDSMEHYQFSIEELDLRNGRKRISAVEKVINAS